MASTRARATSSICSKSTVLLACLPRPRTVMVADDAAVHSRGPMLTL